MASVPGTRAGSRGGSQPARMAPSPFIDLIPLLMCADVPASVRFWLREFEVADPEGHVLMFGQDIGPAQVKPPPSSSTTPP